MDYTYTNVTSRLLRELAEMEASSGTIQSFILSGIEHSEFRVEIIDSIRDNLPAGKSVSMFNMNNCLIEGGSKYYLISFQVEYDPIYDENVNNDELVDVSFLIRDYIDINLALGEFI
jgi:hypothetical protein